jgi:hypothetical protein
MKKSIYFIGTLMAGLLATAAIPQNNEDEKVKVTVVRYSAGQATVLDTTFEAASGYSVEQFLLDNDLDPSQTEIIDTDAFDGKYTVTGDNSFLFMRKAGEGFSHSVEIDIDEQVPNEEAMTEIEVEMEAVLSELTEDEMKKVITHEVKGPDNQRFVKEIVVIKSKDGNGKTVIKKRTNDNGEEDEIVIEEIEEGQFVIAQGENVQTIDVEQIQGEIEEVLLKEGIEIEISESAEINNEEPEEIKVVRIKTERGEAKEGEEKQIQRQVVIYDNAWLDENGFEEEIHFPEYTIAVVTRAGGDESEETSSFTPDEIDLPIEGPTYFPNPTEGKFRLEFFLPERGQTQIQIFDMQGREVFSDNLGNFQGAYNNDIDISKLGRGTYILNINQNNLRLAEKIIVN